MLPNKSRSPTFDSVHERNGVSWSRTKAYLTSDGSCHFALLSVRLRGTKEHDYYAMLIALLNDSVENRKPAHPLG